VEAAQGLGEQVREGKDARPVRVQSGQGFSVQAFAQAGGQESFQKSKIVFSAKNTKIFPQPASLL
jgi:hypothetical protein